MSIRVKITLAFVGVLLVCFVTLYAVERTFVYREFERLEDQMAERNSHRWVQAVEREITHLAAFAGDWTEWDDAYEFVQTGNPEFIDSNLDSDGWFTAFDIPVMILFDSAGGIVWSRCRDPETGLPLQLPELDRALDERGPLRASDDRPEVRGMLASDRGALLVVARAIHRTDGSGPAAGFAVLGRFADQELNSTMARQAVAKGAILTRRQLGAMDPEADPFPTGAGGSMLVRGPHALTSYATIDDLFGDPTIIIRTETPTAISAQGRQALWLSVSALGSAGIAALIVELVVVHRVVLRPLAMLIEGIRNVRGTGDLNPGRVSVSNDEIGQLSAEFDDMARRVAMSHADLVTRSRVRGNAEAASTVTHNLGNVLSSAFVSLEMFQRALVSLRTDGCRKAAGVLRSPPDGDARVHPRAAELAGYLDSLAESLEADRACLDCEIARLRSQIQHMSDILDAQSEVARQGSYRETFDLADTVERAIALIEPSLSEQGIRIVRDARPAIRIQSDPVQITQILVNLLTNARDAIAAADSSERVIRVSLGVDHENVRIVVGDTGCGIEADLIETVFWEGYTTKPAGGGIGLHYCAIAAAQLGGSLAAASEGPGRGATFTLEFPREAEKNRMVA